MRGSVANELLTLRHCERSDISFVRGIVRLLQLSLAMTWNIAHHHSALRKTCAAIVLA